MPESFFNKKETLAQVFPVNFFSEHLLETASELLLVSKGNMQVLI